MRTLWIRPTPASAGTVRHNLTFDLHEAGLADEIVDDLVLIADELVANAIRHGTSLPSGHIRVGWQIVPDQATVSVTDGGSVERPHIETPGLDQTTGRGLAIVNAISDDWGVHRDHQATTVWATRQAGPHP